MKGVVFTSLAHAYRHASTSSSAFPTTAATFRVFDRNVKKLQRNRAARKVQNSRTCDYLRDEIAERLVERLGDVKRKFETVVDYGSGPGHLVKFLDPETTKKIVMVDSAGVALYRDHDVHKEDYPEFEIERILVEDEEILPFEPESNDIVMSNLALHWINDLPGVLSQIQRSLRPDGVFIGSMFGGDTLFELRSALMLAEMDVKGGFSPHISPMTDSQTLSGLLTRANFALPTVDTDEVQIEYPSMFELMKDLQGMGESNAAYSRETYLSRKVMHAAAAKYKEMYGSERGVTATFQIVNWIGWKPAEGQPQALKRGTGKKSLKEVL
ncbi:S-adenosyl-L-methionine-dependent methyltransferase [Atractiella rhizophila]|nr:S-adenosyl-L-methionine-dependent methyltransferase [Atractiella rhizophila]